MGGESRLGRRPFQDAEGEGARLRRPVEAVHVIVDIVEIVAHLLIGDELGLVGARIDAGGEHVVEGGAPFGCPP